MHRSLARSAVLTKSARLPHALTLLFANRDRKSSRCVFNESHDREWLPLVILLARPARATRQVGSKTQSCGTPRTLLPRAQQLGKTFCRYAMADRNAVRNGAAQVRLTTGVVSWQVVAPDSSTLSPESPRTRGTACGCSLRRPNESEKVERFLIFFSAARPWVECRSYEM